MKYEFLRMEHVNLSRETLLEDIQLTVYQGELLGIVGQNQSGKTVLAKLLCGLCQPDSGTLYLDGTEAHVDYGEALLKHKIMYVNYHSRLIASMDICENIGLLEFMGKYGLVKDKKELREKITEVCGKWGIALNPDVSAGSLNKADTHLVLLARAIVSGARMVVIDCITAGYTERQYHRLSDLLKKMVQSGIAVVYVQQGVDQILYEARRVAVLKAGRIVRILFQDELSEETIVRLLAGNVLSKEAGSVIEKGGEVCRLDGLQIAPFAQNITVSLHKGEAVGLAVQEENARAAIAEALFGLRPVQGGDLYVNGEKKKFLKASDAIENGFALIPEGAYNMALFPTMKLHESVNFFTPLLTGQKYGKRNKNVEDYISEGCFADLEGLDKEMLPDKLSNLQSFLLALRKCRVLKPQVYLIVHPTLGIDMWTHSAVYSAISSLLKDGASVLLISPDADELLNLCDKILFLDRHGKNKGTLYAEEIKKEQSRHRVVSSLLEK